jgi:hypothetical protein
LDEKKGLTVNDIPDSFKTDVASELNGVTKSSDAETKIENLLKTDTYKDNETLNKLFNHFTVTIK